MSQFDDAESEFDPDRDEAADLERHVRELEAEIARLEAQLDQVHAMARENALEMLKLRADVEELARRMVDLRRRLQRDRWLNLVGPVLGMILGALSVYLWFA